MITSSLCLSSVVPISLYFSVVLSKFNKGLWQFRKSCEVMFENESQVVKVIINGLHDCHFLLIVVYTLYRERCILHGSLSSFGSMPFTNKCPRGYQCGYTLIFNIVGIIFRNQLLMHAWNYRNCFFFTTCVKCAFYMLWVGISLRRDFKFYATDPKYPQNLELYWTLTPHTFDYIYIFTSTIFFYSMIQIAFISF